MSEPIIPRPEKPDDEIDTGLFVRRLGRVFTAAGNGIAWSLEILWRRFLFISLFVVAGIAVALMLYYIMPPVHKASMTLTSHVLSNDYCAERLSNLQTLVNDQTPDLLASTLKIDEKTAAQIAHISYKESFKPKPKQKDSIITGVPFKVKVQVMDPKILDTLQGAIINYLENTTYSIDRKKIARESMNKMLLKIEEEIEQLDSLKVILAGSIAKGNSGTVIIGGQPADPLAVYKEDISLYRHQLDIAAELSLPQNIIVINGFLARKKPDSPKLLRSITIGILTGGLLGLIIALRKDRRSRPRTIA